MIQFSMSKGRQTAVRVRIFVGTMEREFWMTWTLEFGAGDWPGGCVKFLV